MSDAEYHAPTLKRGSYESRLEGNYSFLSAERTQEQGFW